MRRNISGPGKRIAQIAAVSLMFAPGLALAQTDDCPAPKVAVVNGHAGGEGDEHTLALIADRSINTVIEANRKGVRFFQDVTGGGVDSEYTLRMSGSVDDRGSRPRYTMNAEVSDNKGRGVTAANARKYGDTPGEAAEKIARPLSRRVTPLLAKIREHQREIRESEDSAIAAEMKPEAASTESKVGRAKTLVFTLRDCDGESLADREVMVEVDGPGSVDRTETTSDQSGRVEVAFTGKQEGSATVTVVWKYETVAGIPNIADGMTTIAIKDKDGGQPDECPAPLVMVDPSGPGADYVINLIIEDNKRAVRFLQDPQKAVTGISTGAIDTEYRMTASGSEGAISVRLTDLKGREVASENATYQPGDTTENRDAAASDVADRLNPLLSIIRDSQRHIREEDKSAIAAYMVLTPEDQTVRMAQRAKIKAEVKDCDGAVLSGRESGVELSGPGAVSPMTFEATGSLTYSSPEEGTASITAFWEYETVAGRPNVATGSATVTVKDRPIGTGSPIVANFARSAELLGRFHQLPMVDQK